MVALEHITLINRSSNIIKIDIPLLNRVKQAEAFTEYIF
jgi:hypothetical protein